MYWGRTESESESRELVNCLEKIEDAIAGKVVLRASYPEAMEQMAIFMVPISIVPELMTNQDEINEFLLDECEKIYDKEGYHLISKNDLDTNEQKFEFDEFEGSPKYVIAMPVMDGEIRAYVSTKRFNCRNCVLVPAKKVIINCTVREEKAGLFARTKTFTISVFADGDVPEAVLEYVIRGDAYVTPFPAMKKEERVTQRIEVDKKKTMNDVVVRLMHYDEDSKYYTIVRHDMQ